MMITYTVQLRYSNTNFLGRGPVRPDGSYSVTFGTVDYLSKVLQFNSYSEALAAAQSKYTNISEDYVIIAPTEEPTSRTTYVVQLRHVPYHFLGTKATPGQQHPSLVFDELSNLTKVSHFDSEDKAFIAACEDSDFDGEIKSSYFIITPFTQPTEKRYEVWITIPCKNGLRTYVLSGHNSFVPLLDTDPDYEPLRFSTVAQAMRYMDALELSNFSIMQVDVSF